MRGEARANRQFGGALKEESRKNVKKEAAGAHTDNEPDDSTTRSKGSNSLYRKDGGRAKRALGGITGDGKAPSMGRAGRARGGKATGSDLDPATHRTSRGPKQHTLMPESDKDPPSC